MIFSGFGAGHASHKGAANRRIGFRTVPVSNPPCTTQRTHAPIGFVKTATQSSRSGKKSPSGRVSERKRPHRVVRISLRTRKPRAGGDDGCAPSPDRKNRGKHASRTPHARVRRGRTRCPFRRPPRGGKNNVGTRTYRTTTGVLTSSVATPIERRARYQHKPLTQRNPTPKLPTPT
jgi:hypothetical protein